MPHPSGNNRGRKLFKQFGFTTRPQIVKKSGPKLPPSEDGGLKGIDKRVGSWGKVKAHGLRSMGLFFLLAHEDAAGIGGVATEKRKQQVQGWEAEAFDFWAATRASPCY
jgi:hypothetical protein